MKYCYICRLRASLGVTLGKTLSWLTLLKKNRLVIEYKLKKNAKNEFNQNRFFFLNYLSSADPRGITSSDSLNF